jgi:hypothetical protein
MNLSRKQWIDELLFEHDFVATCSYSRLEFKRVVLQNLALILRYLREERSYFLALKRASKLNQRQSRRASTLINMLAWFGLNVNDTPIVEPESTFDEQLTMQAESYIRTNIIFLWHWFDRSVDHVYDSTRCARAKEGPKRGEGGDMIVQIPESQCRKVECNNANFFHSNMPTIRRLCNSLDKLQRAGVRLSDELLTARTQMREALENPARLYDYANCVDIGDVWHHLECVASGIKDFATTNYKESQHLCPILDLRMKQPSD